MLRTWDRKIADFVEVPIERLVDSSLACIDCRYFDERTQVCQGVGSPYYQKQVPRPDFIPSDRECKVRLPPDLLSFIQC